MGLFDRKREAEINEATEAGRTAFVREREEAEARLLAEADIRDAFGETEQAAQLREYVEDGRRITDRFRHGS